MKRQSMHESMAVCPSRRPDMMGPLEVPQSRRPGVLLRGREYGLGMGQSMLPRGPPPCLAACAPLVCWTLLPRSLITLE
jgi:hypothetical protein